MSQTPLVSILIPTYNMGEFIEEAIDSAIQQTYQNCEIIIVDNCSTDTTLTILKKYKYNTNIFIYKNDSNVGMIQNWNTCLLYAKGKYIKFINADDALLPQAVSCFVKIMEEMPSVSVVTSPYMTFGSQEEKSLPLIPYGLTDGKVAILKSIQTYNWIGSPTQVMFRKKDLKVGFFNIATNYWSDWEFWFKLLLVGDLYMAEEILTKYRIHGGQISRDFDNKFEIEILNFFQILTHSAPFSFCRNELHKQMKEKRYRLYVSAVSHFRQRKYHLAKELFDVSGNNLFSPMLSKLLSSKIKNKLWHV